MWEISGEGPQPHSRPLAESWPELEGPVDAALRIHRQDRPEEHQSLYLFQAQSHAGGLGRGFLSWGCWGGESQAGYPRLEVLDWAAPGCRGAATVSTSLGCP